jgi:hypothetical protein
MLKSIGLSDFGVIWWVCLLQESEVGAEGLEAKSSYSRSYASPENSRLFGRNQAKD